MRYGAMDSNTVEQSCHHEFPNLRLTAFTVTLTTAQCQLSSYISSEDEAHVFITFLPPLADDILV